MQNQRYSRDEFLEMFKQDVIRLSKYIPWLEDKSGDDVSKNYQDGNKMDHTLSFPVYDSILLAFLNDASTTVFMEKNYQYFYTKNHIHDYQDELAMIERADIMHMDILQCILSRYVFGGMVKAYLWKAGVDHKIFVTVIKKARQIVEFWSEPLVIEDEIPAEGYPEEFTYPEVDEADWTDEEFAAVLSGELNAEDIPRLRWEKEHATAGVGNDEAVEAEIKEVVLPADFVFPEVDDADWTDEEFAAVLAGELDPNDIPRMHYEKEHGVKVVFGEPEMATESTQLEEAEPEPIVSQESETESESMETQEPEIEPELPENPEIEPKLPEKPDIEPELPEEPEIEPELPENPDIEPELSEEPDIESELPEEPEIEPELPEKPEIEPELPQEPEVEPELPQESDIEPEQEAVAVAVAEPDDKPNDEPVTESKPIESSEETTPEQETEVPETDSEGETGALE